MGHHIIEQTTSYKYLGVLIDENLSWIPQIDNMCSKLSSVCGILSKVRHYLDRNALMLIYNSLVESRLRYGILSWSTAPQNQLNRLRVLQNKALRFITFSRPDTSMLPLYARLNVLPLDKLILLHQVTFMYCFPNNLLPPVFFYSYCTKPQHAINTRFSKHNFLIPKQNSSLKEKSIKVIGPKVWINVPLEAKALPFRKTFAKHMKKKFISSLPTKQSKRKKFDLDKNDGKPSDEIDLYNLFMNESTDEEFLGFDLDLNYIFNSDTDSEEEFLGFSM